MKLRDEALHGASIGELPKRGLELVPIGRAKQGVHAVSRDSFFLEPEGGRPRTIDVGQRALGIGDLNEVVRVVEEVAKPVLGLGTNLHLASHREVGLAHRLQCRRLRAERHENADHQPCQHAHVGPDLQEMCGIGDPVELARRVGHIHPVQEHADHEGDEQPILEGFGAPFPTAEVTHPSGEEERRRDELGGPPH